MVNSNDDPVGGGGGGGGVRLVGGGVRVDVSSMLGMMWGMGNVNQE